MVSNEDQTKDLTRLIQQYTLLVISSVYEFPIFEIFVLSGIKKPLYPMN